MRKFISTVIIFTLFSVNMFADEGMWIPILIKERVVDMRKNGFKLQAEDIYSVNKACLKDAIVHFGGGCTGELISPQGLLITNHHCGFGEIQSHSSIEHDYLKDGFWAKSLHEELPNKGLKVSFLVSMADVTAEVLESSNDSMSEEERALIVKQNSTKIIKKALSGTHYKAEIAPFYYGNQYFLFVYEVFEDVRLVGAPPSSIGKFGGDTDNWMWPRHTGDFSLFRIYAGKDNKPAPYSQENVPYKPKRYLSISAKGLKEGDFTMVYGFPGRTQEYLMSSAIKYIANISNPAKIALRSLRLDIQNGYMDESAAVRIQYASKNASVANAWKKWQGERDGIISRKTIERREEYERQFVKWSENKREYSGLIAQLSDLYRELEPYSFAVDYYREAIECNEILRLAGRVYSLLAVKATSDYKEALSDLFNSFYKDYYMHIDRHSFIALLNKYKEDLASEFYPNYLDEMLSQHGSVESFVNYLFETSLFANRDRAFASIEGEFDRSKLLSDPAVLAYVEFSRHYADTIAPHYNRLNSRLVPLYRRYMKGQMEFDKDRLFYPDANSTLRVAYGKIKGFVPRDAVYYMPFSTIEGIMQKDNPNIYDYDIPQRLRDLYSVKDYGKWGDGESVPVCFIATNHTTGGNSGSPILNAYGELIGINFDRAWEGTMSDIEYSPDICRNIGLDIRYVLFVIDKVAGADNILKELTIIEN